MNTSKQLIAGWYDIRMKLNLDLFKNDFTYDIGLKHFKPKQDIKKNEIEIDFILTFDTLPQFTFSLYFPVDVSEPEALGALFNELEQKEARELIKVSMCAYVHGHEGAAEWVIYDGGKRWFNQDKNDQIPKPEPLKKPD
jgi:hypothetical protein